MSQDNKPAAAPADDLERRLRRRCDEIPCNQNTRERNEAADAIAALRAELERERESRTSWSVEVQGEVDAAHRQIAALRAELAHANDVLASYRGTYTLARERAERAESELDEIVAAIPGVRYMDLPDGGAPTIAEQVRRMATDCAQLQADLAAARAALAEWLKANGPGGWIDELRAKAAP